MKKPWLSVVMPTYNGGSFLRAALESVRTQFSPPRGTDCKSVLHEGIEIIAVDDGSTDESVAILQSYADVLPLQIIKRKHTGNWVANTNYGLSLARGDYVCFLHQDDCWLPGRLRALGQRVAAHPEINLILHPSWYISACGNRLGVWRCPLPPAKRPLNPAVVIERLLVQNFIAMPAPLFRRKTALQLGGMDESLWYTADWDFWLKLAARGKTLYLSKSFACFRLHPTSQTIRRSDRIDDYRAQLEIVLARHLQDFASKYSLGQVVYGASQFSVEVNSALAAHFHGRQINTSRLFAEFFDLGPAGWFRYLRDSRIIERVGSRLRLRFAAV